MVFPLCSPSVSYPFLSLYYDAGTSLPQLLLPDTRNHNSSYIFFVASHFLVTSLTSPESPHFRTYCIKNYSCRLSYNAQPPPPSPDFTTTVFATSSLTLPIFFPPYIFAILLIPHHLTYITSLPLSSFTITSPTTLKLSQLPFHCSPYTFPPPYGAFSNSSLPSHHLTVLLRKFHSSAWFSTVHDIFPSSHYLQPEFSLASYIYFHKHSPQPQANIPMSRNNSLRTRHISVFYPGVSEASVRSHSSQRQSCRQSFTLHQYS